MKTPQISTKRMAIDKAQAQMVGIVAAAAFVAVFCLIASRAVFSQNRYQARVITAKEKAHKQLQQDLNTFNDLQTAYNAFDGAATNVIGGNAVGTGGNDGPNSKIILDALPPTYDFPALASSIEKILTDSGIQVSSITGTDDQLNQQKNTSSPNPQSVNIPFSFSINNANYTGIAQLMTTLQHSIRPISIDKLDISGGQNNMTATVNAHTYYQPVKTIGITEKAIK